MRFYPFIGSPHLIPSDDAMPPRFQVDGGQAVLKWKELADPPSEWNGTFAATFVVDEQGTLWIADRRSEHVACARTLPVLAAGELYFEFQRGEVHVVRATNQSTGYGPEPSSWEAVARALDQAGLAHPTSYDPEFTFRFCVPCRNLCIVKDEVFECPMCDAPLPSRWNLDEIL